MAEIRFDGVRKAFGDFVAVQGSTFTVPDRTYFTLLGPSGCGKTTSLRMIAGLEMPSQGKIMLDEHDVTGQPVSKRDIAFVFQNYALYPYMTVRKNLAFPLKAEGMPRRRIKERIEEIAELLRLAHHLDRPISRLRGGDRQRVALGRAIVRHPQAFLLDEPLGALDAELRQHMRSELRQLHDRIDATTVMVTHDQIEAMSMADLVAVMNRGEVLQIASPMTLYRRPANTFVAGFVGAPAINFFDVAEAMAAGTDIMHIGEQTFSVRPPTADLPAGHVRVGVRPEYVHLTDDGGIRSRVDVVEYKGTHALVMLETSLGQLMARIPPKQPVAAGDNVGISFESRELLLFDSDSGLAAQAAEEIGRPMREPGKKD